MSATSEEPSASDVVDRWTARWFELDYSWKRLAQKAVQRSPSGSNNLQDWWLKDHKGRIRTPEQLEELGELVRDPDGELWHIAHLPIVWRDGTPTAKANWTAEGWRVLHDLLQNRLSRAGATNVGRDEIVFGQDARAQLQGITIDTLPFRATNDQGVIHAIFDSSNFTGAISKKSAHFGAGTSFKGCLFQRRVNFDATVAEGVISFEDSIFMDKASFDSAEFQSEAVFDQAKFLDAGWFEGATFKSWAFFDGAVFSNAVFPGARFFHNAWFHDATFLGGVEFMDTVFERQASFDRSDFKSCDDMSFWNASFRGDAGFDHLKWPTRVHAFAGAFRNAHFCSMASFNSKSFFQFAAFSEARFAETLTVARTSVFSDKRFGEALAAAREESNSGREHAIPMERGLGQLESAFRALKLAAERQRDRTLELQLHRRELACRRMQTSTPQWERFVSILYDWASAYGNSVLRPLICLAVIWFLASVVYWGWHVGLTDLSAGNFAEAAKLSASSIFRPFEVWSKSINTLSWQNQFLDGFGSGHGLIVRFAITAQSLVSLTLLFLIGLALRRKFQVN